MIFYRNKTDLANAEAFAASAEKYLGFKSISGMNTEFEERTGAAEHGRWDGAFVWCAAEDAGFDLPSLNDPTGIFRVGEQVAKPRRGDIALLAWNMHLGVVTDVSNFAVNGEVSLVEAQVSSGLPRAARDNNGVFLRKRFAPQDIVAFFRPVFRVLLPAPDILEKQPLVHPSNFQAGHAKLASSTELLQRALYAHRDADLENAERGKFDAHTRAAVAQLQRSWGWPEKRANGIPDEETLLLLSYQTGVFRVRGVN
jgi:hypothetical protein